MATPAHAAECLGATTTWTGLGDGHSWTDGANWDAGAPSDTGTAVITAAATAVDGVTGSVCALSVTGPDSAPGPAVTGALTVTGSVTLSGASSWSGRLSSTGGMSLSSSADLDLGDGAVVTLSGTGVLGAGSTVHAPGTPATAPLLAVPGALSLAGAAVLDGVALDLAGGLDLNASTLTVTGAAVSSLREASAVTSPTGNGVLIAAAGSRIVPTTGTTVGANATLRLTSGAVLGEDAGTATLAGSGTFEWVAGALAGSVTTALPTVLDGGGTRLLPPETTLTNTATLVVADGTLDLRGTLANQSSVTLRPGAALIGMAGLPSTLSNPSGATLSVDGSSGGGGSVLLDGVHLVNAGTVTVPVNVQLRLAGSSAPTASDLQAGGTISSPTPPNDSSEPGTLQVGHGATVRLAGVTTLTGARLLLNDSSGNGEGAQLAAGSPTAELTGPETGAGRFSWVSGTVLGAVAISRVTTDIGGSAASSRRIVRALDETHPGRLTLGGTATLNQSTVELAPAAQLVVTGSLTLASAPGGIAPTEGLSGQQLVVGTGATLRHIGQSTTSTGSSNSTAPMTISVPVLNQGTVTVETSLFVPAGYTQDVAPTAPTSAAQPVTGVFAGAVLSGSDGTSAVAPITLTRGGLGGTGTVEANPLTTGTGFVHPGTSSTSGTLTVKGDLVLGSGTDLQIVLRSATDQDKLVVQPLTVGSAALAGSIQLNGTLTGLSQGYDPPFGSTVKGLITAAVRSGTFASGSSSGLSNGYGWRPAYPTTPTVDLTVVDVAPPALGIAGIPAFTQLPSQRFTYSAVDNKSGVGSFDVRWMRSPLAGAPGGWNYPGSWQRTPATSQTLGALVEGYTYCFSVRARDRAGNLSSWSQSLCTAKLIDDRSLSASAGWYRPGGATGYYKGTFSRTSTAGATLRRSGTFRRVAFTALRCRGCGNVLVYSGTTRIGGLSLNGATTSLTSWVSPVLTSRTAVVTLKVTTAGHPVSIDAFGLAR